MGRSRRWLAPERDEFVGRAAELDELGQLWAGGKRLITLLGAGGAGKTRLALRFVRDLPPDLDVAFCDLSQIDSRLACIEAVARALDLPLPASAAPESLGAVIGWALAGDAKRLIVLDNFEQLVAEARPLVEQWLDLAPNAQFIVTSRERLRVRGEHSLELGALPTNDAVELFLARARAVRADLTPGDAQPVLVQLVEKLEGLPLAIELAAARASTLSLPLLLERLARRFETLVDRGSRSPRQATLHATIDWSWQLLDPVEQQALAQCAMFRGGFDLGAAEAVLSTEPGRPVLDVLESLIDRSLLHVRDGRYGLAESVREFCDAKLEPEQRERVRARHAAHYLACDHSRISAELANLTAVFEGALAMGSADSALQAALALEPVLTLRGPLRAFIDLLDRAIVAGPRDLDRARMARGQAAILAGDYASAVEDLTAAAGAIDAKIAVFARARLGVAQVWLGRLNDAESAICTAEERARDLGDALLSGHVASASGLLRSMQGDLTGALTRYREALALFGQCGARREQATALVNLGNRYLERGALSEAEDHLCRALVVFRELDELRLEAHTLGDLGVLYTEQQRFDLAEQTLLGALELSERVGDRHWPGILRGFLGDVALERGQPELARAHYRFAVDRLAEIGDKRYSALFRAALAGSEALLGSELHASEQLDIAQRALDAIGTPDDARTVELWRAIADAARGEHAMAERRRSGVSAAYGDSLERRPPNEVRMPARIIAKLLVPRARLQIAPDGSWFDTGSGRVSLARRTSSRLIVRALLSAHRDCSVEELFAAGWPGQRVHPSSAAHRVHVAIATLRKLGLGDAIVTRGEGYALVIPELDDPS